MLKYLAAADFAAKIGVSRQRLNQMRRSGLRPPHAAEVGDPPRPIWTPEAVAAFAKDRKEVAEDRAGVSTKTKAKKAAKKAKRK